MPWLPLAILLVVALTVAALALILFPPGEGDDLRTPADENGEPPTDESGESLPAMDTEPAGNLEEPSDHASADDVAPLPPDRQP